MDWKSLYRERLMSAEDAVRKIGPKSRIYTSHAAAAPTTLLQAMGDRYEWFDQVTLFNIFLLGEAPFCKPEAAEHLRYQTIFTSAPTREAVNAGRADYIPASYSEVPSLVRGTLRADVALLSVSPPDAHGFCSFGLTCDYQRAAAQTAGLVIAEVNRQMPRVHGDNMIAVEDIDCFVEVDRPLPQMAPAKIGEVERAIGAHCASLIHDGDTLQLGIGAIPDAVLLSLKDKKDLGIHSEMFSDGVVELMEAGVVTNKRKTLLPGVSVSTFLMGSDRLYRFVDDNPAVALYPVDFTNDPRIACQNDNLVAINSCIQVDLYGQVAADMLGMRQFSGTGGQIDFVRSANMSRGGRAIIAMPSTAAKGTISRIVPFLDHGAAVTTGRNDVSYIVTEYGVASLRGKTIRERAEALIGIAHPAFRDELRRQWSER